MNPLLRESTELTVMAVIEDLIQDWGLDLTEGVNPATRLVADLEFASVDIIQLCVALEQAYEQKLGFQALLMHDGSYVGDLTVHQISVFIDERLTKQKGVTA